MRQRAVAVGLFLFLTTSSSSLLATPPDAKDDKKEEAQIVLTQPTQSEVELYEKGPFFRMTGMGMFAASAGDLASTEWGLRHQGLREGNPLVADRGVRIATHVVAPALLYWTTEKMNKAGHGKLALALRVGMMVAYSYAAIHNVRKVHGQ